MKRILMLTLALLMLTGCAAEGQTLTENVKPAEKPNALLVTDDKPVTAFSWALLQRALRAEEANPVLSPLSAYLCLAMLQNGAAGETLGEFQTLLGADTFLLNSLAYTLTKRLTQARGSTQIAIANSAWADVEGLEVDKAFLQSIVDYYGAEAFSVDLSSDAARKAVNEWVSDKTQGLIPKLRDENYPPATVLALINTLYFKAKWDAPFMADNTFDSDFTLESGKTVKAPLMHMYAAYFDCVQTEDAVGAILPYDDGATAFVALKPANGGSARALAASLTAERFAAMLASAEKDTYMDLALPKFEVSYAVELNDMLKELGLKRVFDPASAELTALGTSTQGALYLSLVQQTVKLIVDEKGTEAAAVTEAAACDSAFGGPEPIEMYFDSPFVYAVVERATGLPLFMGVMDDPTK